MNTRITVSAAAVLFLHAGAVARPADETFPRPRDGKVKEETNSTQVEKATVWPTDSKGQDIVTDKWPQKKDFTRDKPAIFDVPKFIQVKANTEPVEVKDVHQRVEQNFRSSGPINDLMIEAVYRDPNNGSYILGNIFGCIENHVGWSTEVRVPDLFADTNGDGDIGQGDELFTFVDLNVFLDAPYGYSLGDMFAIVDGRAFGPSGMVPGMMFSTSPFAFSAEGGWTHGTPFTGLGIAETEHGLTPVPAPGALVLLGAGLLSRRRR